MAQEYNIPIYTNSEYSIDIVVDMIYSPQFITQVIKNITIDGGSNMAASNMRWDSVEIISDPQTIIFRSGISTPNNPFLSSNWVIAFPLCIDSTGGTVIPIITNRTAHGFDISLGEASGNIEYIAII